MAGIQEVAFAHLSVDGEQKQHDDNLSAVDSGFGAGAGDERKMRSIDGESCLHT